MTNDISIGGWFPDNGQKVSLSPLEAGGGGWGVVFVGDTGLGGEGGAGFKFIFLYVEWRKEFGKGVKRMRRGKREDEEELSLLAILYGYLEAEH